MNGQQQSSGKTLACVLILHHDTQLKSLQNHRREACRHYLDRRARRRHSDAGAQALPRQAQLEDQRFASAAVMEKAALLRATGGQRRRAPGGGSKSVLREPEDTLFDQVLYLRSNKEKVSRQ